MFYMNLFVLMERKQDFPLFLTFLCLYVFSLNSVVSLYVKIFILSQFQYWDNRLWYQTFKFLNIFKLRITCSHRFRFPEMFCYY